MGGLQEGVGMVSARAEAGCLGAAAGAEDLSPALGKNQEEEHEK